MRYPSSVKQIRRMLLEWGRTHELLDALGIGKHGQSLPIRVHQLLRQMFGLVEPEPPPDKPVTFEHLAPDEPTPSVDSSGAIRMIPPPPPPPTSKTKRKK